MAWTIRRFSPPERVMTVQWSDREEKGILRERKYDWKSNRFKALSGKYWKCKSERVAARASKIILQSLVFTKPLL